MRLPNWIAPQIALLGWTMALGTAPAQDTPGRGAGVEAGGLGQIQVRGVASSTIFNTVSRDDARAALKVWFDIMAQQIGFHGDSRVDVVDSAAEIRERLQKHSVDLLLTGASEYLEIESSHLMVPVLADARGAQGTAYSYVLLVNPGSGPSTIAGLRGKNILVSSRGSGKTAAVWLDVLLANQKLGRAAAFFASIKVPDKAQACILPLFFGAVDGCVVDEVNLNFAKEMNPQVGRLTVLARSRPMIEGLVGVPAEARPGQKELIEGMLELNRDPRGRQLLMVFKTEHLVRIQPGDLDSARELWRDYNRLTGSSPQSQAGAGPAAESEQLRRGKERY
jgi:ABC-type phosphate/phosphonate transport system substrate-binding protein